MNVGIDFRNFFKHSIPNTFDLSSICPPAYRKRTILTGTIIWVGGPRGSIEIAKCAIFRTNCTTPAQRASQTRAGTRKFNLRGSRVEFQEMGDRPATLFESFLDCSRGWYLNIQFAPCINRRRMSQYFINITRNTSIAAARIKKGKQAKGEKIWLKHKQTKLKNKYKEKK